MSFSLQRRLSGDGKFFELIEGCANQACASIQSVVTLLQMSRDPQTANALIAARRKEKLLSHELTDYLCKTFITPFEREDIESLSKALYKIPKTSEKFAERFEFVGPIAEKVDFTKHAELMQQACRLITPIVHELKVDNLNAVRELNNQLQQIEGEADKLMLESLRILYGSHSNPVHVLFLKELLELLEKLFDHCRDVGNIVLRTILKHS